MSISDPFDDGSPEIFDTEPPEDDSNSLRAPAFGATDSTPAATEGQSL